MAQKKSNAGATPKATKGSKGKRRRPASRDLMPKNRLESFSDGVLAIVITILVLELQVPEVAPGETLLGALAGEWRSYLGYLISFVVVGGAWVTHAEATRMLSHSSPLLMRLTLLWLLFVSLLPFSTALMTAYLGDEFGSTAVAIYGLDLFLTTAVLTVVIQYASRQPNLAANDLSDDHLRSVVRERKVLVWMMGLSMLLALLAPRVAVFLFLVISLAFLLVPLIVARQRSK